MDMCHAHSHNKVPGSSKIQGLTSEFFAGFSSTAAIGDMNSIVSRNPDALHPAFADKFSQDAQVDLG